MNSSYEFLEEILSRHDGIIVRRNVELSQLSKWKIGGPAKMVIEPSSIGDVRTTLVELNRLRIPNVTIGDGSNLLFDDEGFAGAVVKVGSRLSLIRFHDRGIVEAEAGVWVPKLVRKVGAAGLAGCEHAIGIPGTLGGLVFMNGGSQRKGIGDSIVNVTVVKQNGDIQVIDRGACNFAYRHSSLQDTGGIIVSATMQFTKASRSALRRSMLSTLVERSRKFPRKLPNCGSVFVSDPDLYATIGPPGLVIERAGLKGARYGGAQVSPIHANFIVNTGQAKAFDILYLINMIRNRVHNMTGVWLKCEVRHLSTHGKIEPADVVATRVFRT